MFFEGSFRCALGEASYRGTVTAAPARLAGNQLRRVQQPSSRIGRSHFKPCSGSVHDHNASSRSGSTGPPNRLKPVQATGIAPDFASCEQDLVIDAESELLSIDHLPSHIAAGTANLHDLSDLVAELMDVTNELDFLTEQAPTSTESAVLTANDTERLADARTRHQYDEERKARRRAQRAVRKAAKATEDESSLADGFPNELVTSGAAAAERSQPAGTSASSEVVPASQTGLREKRKQGRTSRQDVKVSVLKGARATAAARTSNYSSWGRTRLPEDPLSSAYKLRPAKPPNTKQQALKTAHKYLKLSAYPLLLPAQELELSILVQRLMGHEERKKELEEKLGRPVSHEEWAASMDMDIHVLRRDLEVGFAAKKQMMNANVRLVVSIARKYMRTGADLNDIISDGTIGLMRAVEKFDASRGYRFSTYAHWWIRQAINRSISEIARPIRIPAHLYDLVGKLHRLERELAEVLGRQPRNSELAAKAMMPQDKVEQLMLVWRRSISYDQHVGDVEDGLTMEEVLEDHTALPVEMEADQIIIAENVENVLHTLSERERGVIFLRYGLDGLEPRTLEEVGDVFKVTRERIRQIEQKAMAKLRQPSRSKVCREYCAADGQDYDIPFKAQTSRSMVHTR
eukprot:jgi/Botrbrau1/4773/Bobra.0137s0045.1